MPHMVENEDSFPSTRNGRSRLEENYHIFQWWLSAAGTSLPLVSSTKRSPWPSSPTDYQLKKVSQTPSSWFCTCCQPTPRVNLATKFELVFAYSSNIAFLPTETTTEEAVGGFVPWDLLEKGKLQTFKSAIYIVVHFSFVSPIHQGVYLTSAWYLNGNFAPVINTPQTITATLQILFFSHPSLPNIFSSAKI